MKRRNHHTTRYLQRHNKFLRPILALVGSLRFVAAIVCLTVMLLYVGFGKDDIDRELILRFVKISQLIFIIGIALELFNSQPDKKHRYSIFLLRTLVFLPLIPWLWNVCGGNANKIITFMNGRIFLFVCYGIYSLAVVCVGTMQLLAKRTNPSLILSISFLIFIFVGSFVLMLPKCTENINLRYIDSLFMSASAVTMTGMSSFDAAAGLTSLGWVVIGVLMQIGALGVLTFTSFFAIFFSGQTSIYNQLLMRDFIYSKTIGALIPVILYILCFTLVIETVGAFMIYFTMPPEVSDTFSGKIFFAAFHSVSAFCNCGFSTIKDGMANPILLDGPPLFYISMTILILAGGIGFPNLVNLRDVGMEYLRRLHRTLTKSVKQKRTHIYDLNTKLVLLFSLLFFTLGAITFYVFEFNNAFEGLPLGRKIVQAIFCSATVRTAGFTTYGPSYWSGFTFLIAIFLMWVGCASQSMGGGIKINTFAVVMLNLRSIILGQKGIVICNRTISRTSVRRANAVLCLALLSLFAYSGILMILEPQIPPLELVFEAFAALTTVGISSGITSDLGDLSKIVIASAMFLGRVGVLSVLCGLVNPRPDISTMLPKDDIIIN